MSAVLRAALVIWAVAVKDVRHSRNGRYADVMVERIRELKLERGRIAFAGR